MTNVLRFLLLCLIHFIAIPTSVEAASEFQVFDQERTSHSRLLAEAYQKSRILVLAAANHDNAKVYLSLRELLSGPMGMDPHLKYIVLERPHNVASFYEKLSQVSLPEALSEVPFASESSKQNALCISPEWAYTVSDVFPWVRALNRNRSEPIKVTAVDGVSSDRSIFWPSENSLPWPGLSDQMEAGTCKLSSLQIGGKEMYPALYSGSGNRELDTANNFQKKVWDLLGPNDKAIVIYHHAHVLNGFESCFPFMVEEDQKARWVSNLTRLSWFAHFLGRVPEAKQSVKIVLFDELSRSHNRNGALKFSAIHAARYPQEDWAVPLAPFEGILKQTGIENFREDSFLANYQGGQHNGSMSLPEMADGLVWTFEADVRFGLRKSHDYLPDVCHDSTDP